MPVTGVNGQGPLVLQRKTNCSGKADCSKEIPGPGIIRTPDRCFHQAGRYFIRLSSFVNKTYAASSSTKTLSCSSPGRQNGCSSIFLA